MFDGGSGTNPFRLSLLSQVQGAEGALLVDMSQLGITFSEVAAAQDAMLSVGDGTSGGIITSTSNSFNGLIEGINLTINAASDEVVTIDIKETNDGLVSQVGILIDQFNKLHDLLGDLTSYDERTNKKGTLFGSSAALRIEFDLANVLSSRFRSAGSTFSLPQLGIRIGEDGTLSFDKTKFKAELLADPEGVESFFTQEDTGLAAKLNRVAEQLAGKNNSVLITRSVSLQQTIESNLLRIKSLTELLDLEEKSLTLEFYNLEEAIARLQSNQSSIASIRPITALFGSR